MSVSQVSLPGHLPIIHFMVRIRDHPPLPVFKASEPCSLPLPLPPSPSPLWLQQHCLVGGQWEKTAQRGSGQEVLGTHGGPEPPSSFLCLRMVRWSPTALTTRPSTVCGGWGSATSSRSGTCRLRMLAFTRSRWRMPKSSPRNWMPAVGGLPPAEAGAEEIC